MLKLVGKSDKAKKSAAWLSGLGDNITLINLIIYMKLDKFLEDIIIITYSQIQKKTLNQIKN